MWVREPQKGFLAYVCGNVGLRSNSRPCMWKRGPEIGILGPVSGSDCLRKELEDVYVYA
jgi:hypothetical protein